VIPFLGANKFRKEVILYPLIGKYFKKIVWRVPLDKIKITFLGTGTSHGVPVVDCMMTNFVHCPKGVCEESEVDPKHRRGRASIVVEYNDKRILVDVSQDFREQMLREKVKTIDAILLTHKHADHIMGIPDIRSYSRLVPNGLPVYGSEETIDSVTEVFPYIFDPNTFVGGGIPSLVRHTISESIDLCGLKITPLPVIHGVLKGCFGYRIGNIAYIPDVKVIPEETLQLMQNLDLLIIDCLRTDTPHETHMILPESREVVDRLKPKQTLLTHICHGIHYKNDKKLLNETMDFAFDGLTVEI